MKASRETKVTTSWLVFNDYKVERLNGNLFVSAVGLPLPSEVDDFWGEDADALLTDPSAGHYYFPLWDYPDLFVRFARLLPTSEPLTEEEMLEIVLGWVKNYGVLGVERVGSPAYYGKQRSRRRESVGAFAREARQAARTLDAFEAIRSDNSPNRMREYYKRHIPWLAASSLREMESMLASYVQMQIDEHISRDCYPRFELTPGPPPLSQHFSDAWGFRSLLGAMYLQMRHYTLEPGMLRWCKADDCDRIVTFEPGTPPKSSEKGARGKYRTRADKEYCRKACSQRMRDRKKKDLNS